jgi:hypothetical protein
VICVVNHDLAGTAAGGEPVGHPFGLLEALTSERAAAAGEQDLPLSTRVE